MSTSAGVGYSDLPDSRSAAQAATEAALRGAGVSECDLCILVSTSRHDPAEVQRTVRDIVGPETRLVGGFGLGALTNDDLGYEGHQLGVAVLASDSIRVDLFSQGGLGHDEYQTGLELGKRINESDLGADPNLVIFYESVKRRAAEGLLLNMATPLLSGMVEGIGEWPSSVAGFGTMGDLQWNPGKLWCDDSLLEQSAIVLALSGAVRMDTAIMHGCKPSSTYRTITKTDGPVVLEIDGRPALDVIEELIGAPENKTWEDFPLYVTLGVNKGDRFGEFKEDHYANRLCMAIDIDRRGLVMFEPDLVAGSQVQLMRRSVDFDYITETTDALFEKIGDRRPVLALYIDCAGRASMFSNTDREDAAEIQKAIAGRVPLLGFYSGVEIARLRNDVQALDWTGVLCILSE